MTLRSSFQKNPNWHTIKTIGYYCLPVIIFQWLGVLSSTFSTRFLSHSNHLNLAASGLTYRAFLIVLLCLNGFQFAQGTIIAKTALEQRATVISSLNWMIVLFGLVAGFGLLTVPTILTWSHQQANLVALTVPYFHYLALACPLMAFNGLWQQCFLAYQKPWWQCYLAVLYFCVSVAANHFLILGTNHWQGLGLAGSALAECIAQGAVLLLTLLLIRQLNTLSITKMWHCTKQYRQYWLQAWELGWPIALRWMNEMFGGAVTAIIIGLLGAHALSSLQMVSQLDLIILMVPYSMNIILAIMLANVSSHKQFKLLFSKALYVVIIIMLACSMVFWLRPAWLLTQIFDFHNNHALIQLCAHMLMITGLSQIFNAIRQVCNAALRAQGDTKWPMLYSIFCQWIIGVLGAWLAIHTFHQGMITVWWILCAMYAFGSLLSAHKLWHSMHTA